MQQESKFFIQLSFCPLQRYFYPSECSLSLPQRQLLRLHNQPDVLLKYAEVFHFSLPPETRSKPLHVKIVHRAKGL